MTHLHVVIRYFDRIVDERLVELQDGLVFGTGDDACVSFPGGRLELERRGAGWALDGAPIEVGEPIDLDFGAISVQIDAVREGRRRSEVGGHLRLAVAMLAVALGGAWWDTVNSFVDSHPRIADDLQALVFPTPAFDVAGATEEGDVMTDWEEGWPMATFVVGGPEGVEEP